MKILDKLEDLQTRPFLTDEDVIALGMNPKVDYGAFTPAYLLGTQKGSYADMMMNRDAISSYEETMVAPMFPSYGPYQSAYGGSPCPSCGGPYDDFLGICFGGKRCKERRKTRQEQRAERRGAKTEAIKAGAGGLLETVTGLLGGGAPAPTTVPATSTGTGMPAPKKDNTMTIVIIAIAVIIVLALLFFGIRAFKK